MIYVYDITVNLNNDLIKFYEWEETDVLTRIKKTVLVKLSNEIYNLFIKNSIVVGPLFLDGIKKKTEIFSGKKIEILDYGCAMTNGNDAIFATFNVKGKILERSKFLIDEELEVLELSNNLSIKDIDYKQNYSNYKLDILGREEKRIISLIVNELKLIKNEKEKIEYLYFEWFNKKNVNDEAYEKLIKSIKENFTEKHKEFLNILNLITFNK